jgi:hypothetical protein
VFIQLSAWTVEHRFAEALVEAVDTLIRRNAVCFDALIDNVDAFIASIATRV